MAAVDAGAGRYRVADFRVEDVVAVGDAALAVIDFLVEVLIDGLGEAEEFAVTAVELPEDAVLAHGEQHLLAVDVREHALEAGFHVQRFARDVLVEPAHLAGLRVQRERGVGVERGVTRVHAAACCHPGFGLRGAHIEQPERRVVAAGDPVVCAATQFRRNFAPGLVVGVAGERDGGGAPELLARFRVVPGDEAAALLEALAAVDAAHHHATRDQWACGVRVALRVVGFLGAPDFLAGAGVDGDDRGVIRGEEEAVAVERDVARGAAQRACIGREAVAVLPDEIARGRVDRLDFVVGVRQEHHALVHQRRCLVAALVHGHGPGEAQFAHVAAVHLRERAVALAVQGAAPAEPGTVGRVLQHRLGDGAEWRSLAVHPFAGAGGGFGHAARALPGALLGVTRRGCCIGSGRSRAGIGERRVARAYLHHAVGRERCAARGRAVHVQDVRDQPEIERIGRAGGHRRGHLAADQTRELARGLAVPFLGEGGACERRAVGAAAQAPVVTVGAVLGVIGAARIGLGLRESGVRIGLYGEQQGEGKARLAQRHGVSPLEFWLRGGV